MAMQFDPGRYKVVILDQMFTESPEKRTPGFVIFFRIIARADGPEARVASNATGDVTLWISDKTASRVWHYLNELGYTGKTFRGLMPDTPGFYDLRGRQIELVCVHEQGTGEFEGKTFERWGFPATKPKLRDPVALRRFDRGKDDASNGASSSDGGEEAPVSGTTDDDVPF
jgi:hypothetical protein